MASRTVLGATLVVWAVLPEAAFPQSAESSDRPLPALRAIPLTEPLQIDGRLDEAIYRTEAPASDFVQIEPRPGAAATEKTDVWIAFDRTNVYVAFRNWESDPSRIVAKEMRRDTTAMWGGDDIVAFVFDTFHDRRNGFQFGLNSIGGRDDGQVTNEGQYNGDWNTVWDYQAGRFEQGWVVEVAIPFKSLRYAAGEEQVWGFNALRTNRWKNELSFLSPPPPARGQPGIQQLSLAATVTGISAPSGARNLELKPYAVANARGTRAASGRLESAATADVGGDLKYGITQNLTLDVTYNTDFAQAEADQQQVNLTRFSLFFPEKREFFLENQGTFQFGGAGRAGGDAPLLFYSRRIGLDQGRSIPLDVGGRLTGRVGRYTLGLLDIQAGGDAAVGVPSTNFSVVRVKRDILARSSIGVMAAGRYASHPSPTDSTAYGVDATLGFFRSLTINSYWARTEPRRSTTDNTSTRAQLDYNADRYGLQLERLDVGRNFVPEVGFVRRTDIARSSASARFSPRPQSNRYVRKFYFLGSANYVETGDGRLDTRVRGGGFEMDLQNSDRVITSVDDTLEQLVVPFRIAPGVTLPVGSYAYRNLRLQYNRAGRHRLSGNLFVDAGTFYNGTKRAFGVTSGRLSLTPQLAVEPTYSVNRVELAQGDFTTHLAGFRATYTPTARMFASAFLQYSSSAHTVSANVRLRWEYQPGSELFVVLNEERDTLARRFPETANRAFIVKVNRLFRF